MESNSAESSGGSSDDSGSGGGAVATEYVGNGVSEVTADGGYSGSSECDVYEAASADSYACVGSV